MMKSFGNLEALEEAIKKKYDEEIDKIRDETNKQAKKIRKDTKEEISKILTRAREEAEIEAKREAARVLSEEKLNAKKEFEATREKAIEKAFKELERRSKEIVHSETYLEFLKRQVKGIDMDKFLVVADSDYYKRIFPKYKKDPSISGVKLVSHKVTYDFTLESMIEANKEKLRLEMSKILF